MARATAHGARSSPEPRQGVRPLSQSVLSRFTSWTAGVFRSRTRVRSTPTSPPPIRRNSRGATMPRAAFWNEQAELPLQPDVGDGGDEGSRSLRVHALCLNLDCFTAHLHGK